MNNKEWLRTPILTKRIGGWRAQSVKIIKNTITLVGLTNRIIMGNDV